MASALDSTSGVDILSAAASVQATQRENLSKYALIDGLKKFQNKQYKEAAVQLQKAIGFNPNSVDAYNTLANTYLQMDKTNDAITAYKQVVRLSPNSEDAYKNLGNAYLQAKRYGEAETQFKAQAQINPSSTYPPYTLGLMYSQTNRLNEAADQFSKVISLDKKDSHGYYGLGMVYNRMGRYDEAVTQLEQATKLKKDFSEAQVELGNAYAALGQDDKAADQVTILNTLDSDKANTLRATITHPKILAAFSTNIDTTRGAQTPLSALNAYLATPNASKDFTMTFQFDSEMDVGSVQNLNNWSISKATGDAAGIYNNGINLNVLNDTKVSPIPKDVTYDQTTFQAVVTFSLSQNASGTGVIDPSHIVFKFAGYDLNGKAIDPTSNEFDGFAGSPF